MEGLPLRNVIKVGDAASIPVSSSKPIGTINMLKMRDLILTTKCAFAAGAVANLRINIYYSPDGKIISTVPWTYYDITVTAASTVIAASPIIDCPSIGYFIFRAENLDVGQVVTSVEVIAAYSLFGEEYKLADRIAVGAAIAAQSKRFGG